MTAPVDRALRVLVRAHAASSCRTRARNACSMSSVQVLSQQSVRGVVGDQPALAHQQQPVAAGGLVHHVAGDQHRGAGLGEPVEGLPQLDAQHRVEADGGLVEDQQRRFAEQRDGQRDPASAGRRRAGRRCWSRWLVEGDGLDALVDPVGADAEDPGEEAEVLGDGEVVVHAGLLGDVADLVAQGRRRRRAIPSTSTLAAGDPLHADDRRISVVLPQPEGPSRPVTWPDLTKKSRSRRTSLPPRVDAEAAHRRRRYSSCDELSTAGPEVKGSERELAGEVALHRRGVRRHQHLAVHRGQRLEPRARSGT